MCTAAPSKMDRWIIYCTYTDENDTMDTVFLSSKTKELENA